MPDSAFHASSRPDLVRSLRAVLGVDQVSGVASPRAVASALAPLDLAGLWPLDCPLVLIHSGRVHERWSRWSLLAEPRATLALDHDLRWSLNNEPLSILDQVDPLAALDLILAATQQLCPSASPFASGWAAMFSYDLGRIIEPAAHRNRDRESDWPLIELLYCPAPLFFDHVLGTWHACGGETLQADPLRAAKPRFRPPDFTASPLRAVHEPEHYMHLVDRTIEFIAAGDVFQANIAQHFTSEISGRWRDFGRMCLADSGAWYGAYLELCGARAVASMSPELFLSFDPVSRLLTTRPIKGTRPAAAAHGDLAESEKDAAELHMIIDLMRNDLGRVCDIGSIRVPAARVIESHPTVHHGVGEVVGRVREGISFGEILRATFPPGSVTGAPKIRAMQVIDELEDQPRGPYTGCIGFLSDAGAFTLNVAIRTALLVGDDREDSCNRNHGRARLTYAAGCGIVADSNAAAELQESYDKTAALRQALARSVSAHPLSA